MEKLTNTDLKYIINRIPKDVTKLIKHNKIILAGGFIRATIASERVSDIDLFGSDQKELETIAYKFANETNGRVHVTGNAFTILRPPRLPIQIITRWLFDEPEKCIESFDFTMCKAAIWYDQSTEKWDSSIHPCFYSDLAARRLVYVHPDREEEPGGSLLRVRKFLSIGYSIQAQSLAGVLSRIFVKISADRVDVSNEADVSKIIVGLLREVDPDLIVDGVDVVDEHEKNEEVEGV